MTTATQRLTRDEIEELVDELKDNAAYGTADRYPVVIEASNYYLVWVEADTAAKAVEAVKNDGEWYELISGDTPFGGDMTAREPDAWEADETSKIGPLNQCSECSGRQHYAGSSAMFHEPSCSKRPS